MTRPVYLGADTTPALRDLAVGAACTVGGDQARHAIAAKRLREREELDLVDGEGLRVTVRVGTVERRAFSGIVTRVTTEDAAHPALVLVQALAKNKRDLQAIESATEIGVDRVYPWAAERSVVTWKASDAKGKRWDAALTSANEQSRRARWASCADLVDTPALAEAVREATAAGACVFLTDAAAGQTLPDALAAAPDRPAYWVIVGPEGGITDSEIATLQGAGAHPVRLGRTIMRASTAGPAALAVIAASLRWGKETPHG